jgi:LPS-assembly lipoprotein
MVFAKSYSSENSWVSSLAGRMLEHGLVLSICLLLSSCGFHLRGTGSDAVQIPAIHVSFENSYGELSRSLEALLVGSGTQIVENPTESPWSLFVSAERNSRRVASTNSQISVAQYELQMLVEMRLENRDGSVIIPATTLSTDRLYEYDSSNLTGSDAEEQVLRAEMRSELAERILRRVKMTIKSQAAA